MPRAGHYTLGKEKPPTTARIRIVDFPGHSQVNIPTMLTWLKGKVQNNTVPLTLPHDELPVS